MSWSETVDFSEVCHRVGGRRAYNARRQLERQLRRTKVLALMQQWGWSLSSNRGVQLKIARHLGVSEATISRDVWAILRQ